MVTGEAREGDGRSRNPMFTYTHARDTHTATCRPENVLWENSTGRSICMLVFFRSLPDYSLLSDSVRCGRPITKKLSHHPSLSSLRFVSFRFRSPRALSRELIFSLAFGLFTVKSIGTNSHWTFFVKSQSLFTSIKLNCRSLIRLGAHQPYSENVFVEGFPSMARHCSEL